MNNKILKEIYDKAILKTKNADPMISIIYNILFDFKYYNNICDKPTVLELPIILSRIQESKEAGDFALRMINRGFVVSTLLEEQRGDDYRKFIIQKKPNYKNPIDEYRATRRWKMYIINQNIVALNSSKKMLIKYKKETTRLNWNEKYKWLRDNYPVYIKRVKIKYPKQNFK